MKTVFGVLILVTGVQTAHAGCNGDQIEKMIDKGFSKSEIRELCVNASNGSNSSNGANALLDSSPTTKQAENSIVVVKEDPEEIAPGYSTTCHYTTGPKAGKVHFSPPGSRGVNPSQIGTPCSDGVGSCGVAVADKKR